MLRFWSEESLRKSSHDRGEGSRKNPQMITARESLLISTSKNEGYPWSFYFDIT